MACLLHGQTGGKTKSVPSRKGTPKAAIWFVSRRQEFIRITPQVRVMRNNAFANPPSGNMMPPPPVAIETALLSTMLLAKGAPEFSGKPEDWREFSRDFVEYLDNACAGSQGLVSDAQKLMLLGTCLDKRTQRTLRTRREVNPDLTFDEYWRELKTLYGGDMDGNRKRA